MGLRMCNNEMLGIFKWVHFWLQCVQDRWWAQINGVDGDKSDAEEFLKLYKLKKTAGWLKCTKMTSHKKGK